jgi:hypothetical protein
MEQYVRMDVGQVGMNSNKEVSQIQNVKYVDEEEERRWVREGRGGDGVDKKKGPGEWMGE